MSLFSDLIASGRVRDREQLRRVYRSVVKRLHPDSAALGRPRGFFDFDRLRKELDEAELLLAELEAAPCPPADTVPAKKSKSSASAPLVAAERGGEKAARRREEASPGEWNDASSPLPVTVDFDRSLLIAELRDLVARGFPVNERAAARNKAYRNCIAKVTAQLSMLTGESDRFSRLNSQMKTVKYASLRLHYYVMQVLWNGLDWALRVSPYPELRNTALRDLGLVRDSLLELGFVELEALLAWIVEAERGLSKGSRTGLSAR